MADIDTLSRALKRAHGAGDTNAARKFASEIRRLRTSEAGSYDGVKHPEFDPANVPGGVEGYNPETGMVERQFGKAESFGLGAADTATFGFADELASYPASMMSGIPREQVLSEMRGNQANAQKQNPKSYLGGQVAGGVVTGIAAGPATLSARAGTALGGRVVAGMADGAIAGGLYGAGSGTDASSRGLEAAKGAGIGAVAGGAFPVASSLAGSAYTGVRNALSARPIAQQAGATPEALRMLGNVMDADGSLGPVGQANMTRAGRDAMLADAGPNARSVLDTAVQRGGPGAVVARDQISQRTTRAANDLTGVLDTTMGKPGESLSRELVVYGDKTNPMSLLYKRAYETPIDYSNPAARRIEQAVKGRVPPAAIKAANELMRVEGNQSKQILASLGDDGSVVFETLPDVRQLDYITRGLNEVAEQADGAGKLGGTTATGRAYANLSREIRNDLKELVPEYKDALDRAGTEIRKVKAEEFGTSLLSPSVTRDQVREFVQDMPGAERRKLIQGVRSQIDDAMARVSRTVQDGDVPAREAIKAIRDLSTRANREKLALALGDQQAGQIFQELDRVAMSFDLRASVADNSKTYARQSVDRRIGEITEPGIVGTAAQGKPLNALQRVAQSLTGQTPERIRGRQDEMYSEIAQLLTRQGGAGQGVYNAINQLGQTDRATQLIAARLARAGVGPRLSYPATALISDRLRNR